MNFLLINPWLNFHYIIKYNLSGVELTDMMIDDLEKEVEEDETTEARKA
jgi:hypothetical protein